MLACTQAGVYFQSPEGKSLIPDKKESSQAPPEIRKKTEFQLRHFGVSSIAVSVFVALLTGLSLGGGKPCIGQGQNTPSLAAPEEESVRRANFWNQEGMQFFAKGKYWQALQSFSKVFELYPDNPDVAFNYGMALQTLGQYQRAIAPLLKALEGRPADPDAHRSLAVCYVSLGRLEEGVAELEKSFSLDSSNIHTLFYLAVSYHKLRQDDKANQILQLMAERNTGSPLTAVYLARALRFNKNCPAAEKIIERAIQLAPELVEVHFERGSIARCQNRVEEAERSLQEALRLDPERPALNVALGEVYLLGRRDPDRAIPYFERAIQYDPDDAQAYYDLGNAQLKKNRIEAAKQSLTRAIRLDPEDRRAHYLLGKVLQLQGDKAGAEEEFALSQKLQAQERRRLRENFESRIDEE